MAQEKRQAQRVKKDFGILCKVYRKIELEGNLSKIVDISRRGLSFMMGVQTIKDDILHLTFRVPPDFKKKIEIFGRVVSCTTENGQEFKTRVAFIDIDSDTSAALNQIIEQTKT